MQRVRGAQVTDLFTSSDQAAPTSWNEEEITHTPADITILSGDKLRLRLEFWSNESASADRLFQYRWGGDDDDYKGLNGDTQPGQRFLRRREPGAEVEEPGHHAGTSKGSAP